MSFDIDPQDRAQLERARREAQEALQRAKLIVERSRMLLWSQDAGSAASPSLEEPPAIVEVPTIIEPGLDDPSVINAEASSLPQQEA